MPAGLKSTSSPIQVSEFSIELVAGTFVSEAIDLSLNPLDQEVFVVTQVNLDVDAPDSITGLTTAVDATLSTVQRTTLGSIANSNVLASARREIICNAGMTPDGGIPFDREDPTFTALTEDYLGIIATSNCFLNLQGTNNGNVKQARVRIFGYRATASSSVYAALVQSEVLSA
tara:strand:+ start:999 stop:1517 length:519 start_codon:yes stop_codon:yes gene_type:complete